MEVKLLHFLILEWQETHRAICLVFKQKITALLQIGNFHYYLQANRRYSDLQSLKVDKFYVVEKR